MPLSVEIARADGVVTVVLYGELDVATAPALCAWLAELPGAQTGPIVFELAGLAFTDCAGARALADAGLRPPEAPRPVLRHARPAVRRVLELTGLDTLCDLDPG